MLQTDHLVGGFTLAYRLVHRPALAKGTLMHSMDTELLGIVQSWVSRTLTAIRKKALVVCGDMPPASPGETHPRGAI